MASQVTLILFAYMAIAAASGKMIQQQHSGHVVQHAKVHPQGYQPPKKYIYIDWCKSGKYAEDPKDCSRYLQKVGYYAYSMPCAPGTHWSQKKCACATGDCHKPNKYIYVPKKYPVYQKRGHGRPRPGPPHPPPPPPSPPHQGHEQVHQEHPPPEFHGQKHNAHEGFGQQSSG